MKVQHYAAVWPLLLTSAISIEEPPNQLHPAWAPDGSAVAYLERSDGSHAIQVVDTSTGEMLTVVDHVGPLGNPAFSSDGKSLAFVQSPTEREGHFQLTLLDMKTEKREILYSSGNKLMHPRFHPSEDLVSFVEIDEEGADIRAFDLASGWTMKLTATPGIDEFHPKWDREGTSLVFDRHLSNCQNLQCHQIVELEIDGGEETILFAVGNAENVGAPSYSADRSRMIFSRTGNEEPGLWTIKVATG